jgi:hypothetical protein
MKRIFSFSLTKYFPPVINNFLLAAAVIRLWHSARVVMHHWKADSFFACAIHAIPGSLPKYLSAAVVHSGTTPAIVSTLALPRI